MLIANPAHHDWYEDSASFLAPFVEAHNAAGRVYDKAYHLRYYGEEGRRRYRDALHALDASWEALQAAIKHYDEKNPKPPALLHVEADIDGDEAWHEWKAKPYDYEAPGVARVYDDTEHLR